MLVVLLSTLITFSIGYFSSDSPAVMLAGETATPEQIAALNHEFGLDQSFVHQYTTWLWHALHGDLGASYISRIPVSDSITQKLPVDLSIMALAIVFAIAGGFTAGMIAAVRRGGMVDRAITAASSVALAVPEFWSGILLVIVFAVHFRTLPASGYTTLLPSPGEWLRHIVLPSVTLAAPVSASVARQLRTSLVGVLAQNYITGAVVRGLSPRRILFKHALRNAAAPTIATIGLAIPQLLGGAVVVETVFALPGLGQFAVGGAQSHDLPVIQGVLLVTIAVVLVANTLSDAVVGALRAGGGG